MPTFIKAIGNTLKVGFLMGILSTAVGLPAAQQKILGHHPSDRWRCGVGNFGIFVEAA
jgi:hypothetical protein